LLIANHKAKHLNFRRYFPQSRKYYKRLRLIMENLIAAGLFEDIQNLATQTDYTQSDLNKVALRLNQRSRQTLGFQTPASKLQESVASTH